MSFCNRSDPQHGIEPARHHRIGGISGGIYVDVIEKSPILQVNETSVGASLATKKSLIFLIVTSRAVFAGSGASAGVPV
jgi:hypothetical protein